MSRNRYKHQPDVHVPARVVAYLGRISGGAMLIGGFLVWRIIETSAGSQTAADAAVIGLVMAFLGFGTGGMTALGAILASTRSGNEPQAPVPVEGVPGGEPLPVVPERPADAGKGEARLIAIFAAAGLLALVLYHFLAPHLH